MPLNLQVEIKILALHSAGEMAQLLRTLAAFPEDTGSVLNTYKL